MKREQFLSVQNLKLRRQLREEREATLKAMDTALKDADYERWVAGVNANIAAINTSIRATNGPRYGTPTSKAAEYVAFQQANDRWTKTS